MALEKLKQLVQEISKDPNVKKVIKDAQKLKKDVQAKITEATSEESLKKYKALAQSLTEKEGELQKEVTKVLAKVKKSASEAEKNLATYKKLAQAQRSKIEKALKAKAQTLGAKKASGSAKSASKKSTKKTAKKASKK